MTCKESLEILYNCQTNEETRIAVVSDENITVIFIAEKWKKNEIWTHFWKLDPFGIIQTIAGRYMQATGVKEWPI